MVGTPSLRLHAVTGPKPTPWSKEWKHANQSEKNKTKQSTETFKQTNQKEACVSSDHNREGVA